MLKGLDDRLGLDTQRARQGGMVEMRRSRAGQVTRAATRTGTTAGAAPALQLSSCHRCMRALAVGSCEHGANAIERGV